MTDTESVDLAWATIMAQEAEARAQIEIREMLGEGALPDLFRRLARRNPTEAITRMMELGCFNGVYATLELIAERYDLVPRTDVVPAQKTDTV